MAVLNRHTAVSAPERSPRSGKQAAKDILLLSSTAALAPGVKERISQVLEGAVDWAYLLRLAQIHGVASLMAYNFHASGLEKKIPQPYSERLNKIYNSNLFRNIILSDELMKVLSAFGQQGIPVISLKGIVLAEMLYQNPALRTMSDIDIMVPPEKLPQAKSLLLGLGYRQLVPKQTWKHYFHEAPYCKEAQVPIIIELHWNLGDPRLMTVPQQEIWNRAQHSKIVGETALVLSLEDTLLFLSNHLFKHDNNLLRSLCDITELLKKYHDVVGWDYFVNSARSWQIEMPAYCSLALAREFLGAPVPESAIAVLKPGAFRQRLLNFLLERETFISTISGYRLRKETSALFRGLLMKHVHQTLIVLSRQHGTEKWWAWVSTTFWVACVVGAALGRNVLRGIRKGGRFFR
jgi:hypothetical protein